MHRASLHLKNKRTATDEMQTSLHSTHGRQAGISLVHGTEQLIRRIVVVLYYLGAYSYC
jgi:hypothetical protein